MIRHMTQKNNIIGIPARGVACDKAQDVTCDLSHNLCASDPTHDSAREVSRVSACDVACDKARDVAYDLAHNLACDSAHDRTHDPNR